MAADCLFCRIIQGQVPSRKVYEDELVFAFEDIQPGAPTHILLVPKRHLSGLAEAGDGDTALLGELQIRAAALARERGLRGGYRTVLNVGPDAGQSVSHLHLHLLGGRQLNWPPG
ncbi:MAG: histidine triad nucleotide-binding protein [Terriglobales bacterium]